MAAGQANLSFKVYNLEKPTKFGIKCERLVVVVVCGLMCMPVVLKLVNYLTLFLVRINAIQLQQWLLLC